MILIASCSVDAPTWEPVAANLDQRGYDVFTFEADKVALGETSFELSVGQDGLEAKYSGEKLCIDGINAAWFRRPSFITNPQENGAAQMSLDMERRFLQAAVWDEVPNEMWLNAPSVITKAERKLSQLKLAQKVGFVIPPTVVSNRWETIQTDLPNQVICKPSYSIFYDGSDYKPLYTTPFTNSPTTLPVERNPYPGIWQPALEKAREWRITAVGEETFDAAIYTKNGAKDDWRKHQLVDGLVKFKKERFSDELKEKCLKYLGEFGLRFGAFDFIEDSEGKVTFLECNPNGQFMWLEKALDLPISSAIADELVKIVQR